MRPIDDANLSMGNPSIDIPSIDIPSIGNRQSAIANKKARCSFKQRAGQILPAVTYSPTQLPTQYHRR
jgi:hypothetical protein